MSEGMVDGYPHQIWWNADGETVVESYSITDMAHGTPLGKAENDERYGKEGPFMIEAGISSSHHIASFFGLTGGIHQPEKVAKPVSHAAAESPSAKLIPLASPISPPVPDLNKVLRPLAAAKPPSTPPLKPKAERGGGLDVGAVITRALTAAGLMK
jgi:hypothetical protein